MGNFFTKNDELAILKERINKLETTENLIDESNKIIELKKEIESLKQINKNLENELKIKIDNNDNKKIKQLITKQQIQETVDKILENQNINIKYLPDVVERQLYINILTILINLLDETLSSSSIKLLGFEINFDLEPTK